MKDEYSNLNAQDLYDKFVEKYKKIYNNVNEKEMSGDNTNPNEKEMSDKNIGVDKKKMSNFNGGIIKRNKKLIILFSLSICANQILTKIILKHFYNIKQKRSLIETLNFKEQGLQFFKNISSNKHHIIFLISIIVFVIYLIGEFIAQSFESHKKELANKAVDEVFKEEEISVTKEKLTGLIEDSQKVGGKLLRIYNETKRILTNASVKALIISFFGFIVTIVNLSIEYSKDIDPMYIISMLFELYCIILGILILFLTLGYGIDKFVNFRKNLYLEVLEDKKLTLELKKEKIIKIDVKVKKNHRIRLCK